MILGTSVKKYNGVIMGATASQITSLTIVYSTVYSDADQRKHQSSASLAFVRWIHRGPENVSIWWRHHVGKRCRQRTENCTGLPWLQIHVIDGEVKWGYNYELLYLGVAARNDELCIRACSLDVIKCTMTRRMNYRFRRNDIEECQSANLPHYMMTSSNGNIFPRYWPFAWGIHRSPGNSPHNGQWRGALMFSLICA